MMRSVMPMMIVVCVSAAAARAGTTDQGQSRNTMTTMEEQTTYTGCLEKGSAAGTFTLTHAERMGADSMMKDSMMKDSMVKGSMKPDSMKPDAMAKETGVTLVSPSVDLSEHVGHQVEVTGASSSMSKNAAGMATSTFTVKMLKVVASSCS